MHCWIAFIFLLTLVQLMVSTKVDLNGYWFVSTEKVSHLVGFVPGGIYSDLRNGFMLKEDPLYRFNDEKYRWVANKTWTYKKDFTASESFLNKTVVKLVCEGMDTVSKIYINNKYVGNTENMFVKYEFDVKKLLMPGTNNIKVVFTSPTKYATNQYSTFLWKHYPVPPTRRPPSEHGESHMNFIRKMQCSFGWDWGPAFPSVGIWKSIWLDGYNGIVIDDVTVHTHQVSEPEDSAKRWTILVKLFIKKGKHEGQTGDLIVSIDNATVAKLSVELNVGFDVEHSVNVSIPKEFGLKLWWPNGYGDQNLYTLDVMFKDNLTKEKAIATRKVGFRTIELIQEPVKTGKGLTFFFKVNGIPMFAKGSNWIPAEIFPEKVTDSLIYDLLLSAKNGNMNMLRVWGGGVYESDYFYQLADEMGILIWQDMMFACAMYPTDEQFLNSVSTEIAQQIRRLQHHPSIALWAGNNENEAALVQNWYQTASKFQTYKDDYVKLYVKVIRPIVLKEDPGRVFLSSSPTNGEETEKEGWVAKNPASNYYGDVHFYNYFKDLWKYTVYPRARFISEYGYQAWPSFETVQKISSPEDWNWNSKFVGYRQHVAIGQASLTRQIQMHFDVPENENNTKNFISMTYLTQINQAMAIKTETEAYRRYMSELDSTGQGQTMGALYWQLNDVWQAPSWSSIEYGGKWKMLHYFARRFFSAVLVSPYISSDVLHVYVVLDEPGLPQHYTLAISVYSWKSLTPAYTHNFNFSVSQFIAKEIFSSSVAEMLKAAHIDRSHDCFFYFNLTDQHSNEVMSTNFIFSSEETPEKFSYLQSIDLKPQIDAHE